MSLGDRHVVIAGVTKSATTSLFTYLAQHPGIRASSTKETNYFTPARFDQPLPALAAYESSFPGATSREVTMEASPGYFYGGYRIARSISSVLPAPTVILCFREPVSRLKSFFHFHKEKELLPKSMPLSDYVDHASQYSVEDFRLDRSLERWFGVTGGLYDTYFPEWSATFGDRLLVTWFDDIKTRPYQVVTTISARIGLAERDEAGYLFDVENQTVRPRLSALHSHALAVNSRLEPFLRRHMGLKTAIRRWYRAVNTVERDQSDIDLSDSELDAIFAESIRRFRGQVSKHGVSAKPSWLDGD